MTTEVQFFAEVGLAMSDDNPVSKQPKISVWRHRVTSASAKAYVAAADDAARALTAVGALFIAVDALSEGTKLTYGIHMEIVDGSVAPPASDAGVYPFDKFAVSEKAGFDHYQNTIPGRNMGGVFIESDGVSIIIGSGAQTQTSDFISALEAVGIGKNGSAVTVERMFVAS